jgi:hypothetical protein
MKKHATFISLLFLLILFSLSGQGFAQLGTNCLIKGIIGSDGTKMYLVPGHYLYDQVTGECWFCSAAEAEQAGFVFIPDPSKPQLRPSKPTPTPPPEPTATPEPQITEEPEPEQPTEEPTVEPAPAEPVEEPAPIETSEPVVITSSETEGPTDEPFDEPDIMVSSPDEAQALLMQFMPMLMAYLSLILGIFLFILVVIIVIWWKIFTKAGQPGWGALIPIYSQVLMLQVAGLPWWLIILGLIPVLNFIFLIVWIFVLPFKLAANFDKGFLYGLGLFLPVISIFFWIHLAFSDAEYVG